MTTVIRIFQRAEQRLGQYRLATGEYYFSFTNDDNAITIGAVDGGDVKRVPYSSLARFKVVTTPLIFLDGSSLTIVNDGQRSVWLFKQLITDDIPHDPAPLVSQPEQVTVVADQVRQLALNRRLMQLGEFSGLVQVLHNSVTDAIKQALNTGQLATDSIAFLRTNSIAAAAEGQLYSEIHRTSLEQLRCKLDKYEQLLSVFEQLLTHKRQVELLTRDLQLALNPLTEIADDMIRIS